MYESKISDAMWVAYDIPGNVGWVAFLTELILCFSKRPEILEIKAIFVMLLIDLLCGLVMLVGVAELIAERICRPDLCAAETSPVPQLCTLAFGGLAGLRFSLIALMIAILRTLGGIIYRHLPCGGSLLCFVFAGLLLREYKSV